MKVDEPCGHLRLDAHTLGRQGVRDRRECGFASNSVSALNVSPIDFTLHHSLLFFRPLDRQRSRLKPLGQTDAAIRFDKLGLDAGFPVVREFARDGAMADSKLK